MIQPLLDLRLPNENHLHCQLCKCHHLHRLADVKRLQSVVHQGQDLRELHRMLLLLNSDLFSDQFHRLLQQSQHVVRLLIDLCCLRLFSHVDGAQVSIRWIELGKVKVWA